MERFSFLAPNLVSFATERGSVVPDRWAAPVGTVTEMDARPFITSVAIEDDELAIEWTWAGHRRPPVSYRVLVHDPRDRVFLQLDTTEMAARIAKPGGWQQSRSWQLRVTAIPWTAPAEEPASGEAGEPVRCVAPAVNGKRSGGEQGRSRNGGKAARRAPKRGKGV